MTLSRDDIDASADVTDGRARRTRPRRWLIATAVVAAAALALPAAALVLVVLASREQDTSRSDVIVVLGASQYWGKPSPVLQERLSHALALRAEGVSTQILTVGANRPGDNTTEAAAGRAWLVHQGVPADAVTAVAQGRDTVGSLLAVAGVMADRGWASATIVTDPAHEARSLAIARALGITAHGSPTTSGPGSSLTWDYVVHEVAGLLHFQLMGRHELKPVLPG